MTAPFRITSHETDLAELKFCLMIFGYFFGGRTYFQKTWRTFTLILNWVGLLQELLGTTRRKKQTTFDLPDQSVFIDLLEARN